MSRAQTAALLASCYLLWVFVRYRVRLFQRQRSGPLLSLLRRFDYRAVLAELEPLYTSGLPPGSAVRSPGHDSHMAPSFFRESPWERTDLTAHSELLRRLRAGQTPEVEPSDASLVSLLVHSFIRRLVQGDMDGAEAVARLLPPEHSFRLKALASLARAERAEATRDQRGMFRSASVAQSFTEAALSYAPDSRALHYLAAHVRLTYFTHAVNLEWEVSRARAGLRRAAEGARAPACFHHALAHAAALVGQQDESVDELARALYYAQADPFYARPILESPYVARVRPALVAECREHLRASAAPADPLPPIAPGR